MNLAGLKKLDGQRVRLYPAPQVMPELWEATMQWIVQVDTRARIVQLQAPSGHFFDATDVIHHFQKHGSVLILDAQVMIDGNEVHLIPKPWGRTARTLNQAVGEALLRGGSGR